MKPVNRIIRGKAYTIQLVASSKHMLIPNLQQFKGDAKILKLTRVEHKIFHLPEEWAISYGLFTREKDHIKTSNVRVRLKQ